MLPLILSTAALTIAIVLCVADWRSYRKPYPPLPKRMSLLCAELVAIERGCELVRRGCEIYFIDNNRSLLHHAVVTQGTQ